MDAVDRQILNRLVVNGRASLTDIATEVSLSVPAVKRRVTRLERDGIIRGYTTIVAEPGNSRIHALVEVFCTEHAQREDAVRLFESRPEVRLAYTVAGDSDLILLVRTDNADHLEQLLIDLRSHPIVLRTRAQLMLNSLIDRVTL
ncbi:Lrp/AsnC family transcriptional regulator [Actinophytocola sp.]|uniref:Lrp/AsnC family transcriptional regulator n=1 Tax=Actinophytocola sp. TaxID=1872138 RepID=UPI002D4BC767|nr:Lrp/AsnC family transcriptional regulator [Actinophytocola sp.]HYQ61828.1 Lrp/AsnC family transcriptional regulator [Actinophytocola sp.]